MVDPISRGLKIILGHEIFKIPLLICSSSNGTTIALVHGAITRWLLETNCHLPTYRMRKHSKFYSRLVRILWFWVAFWVSSPHKSEGTYGYSILEYGVKSFHRNKACWWNKTFLARTSIDIDCTWGDELSPRAYFTQHTLCSHLTYFTE